MTGGAAATENRMEGSGGVGDDANVAEVLQASLPEAVEDSVKLGLVLAADPTRGHNRGEVARVCVCAHAVKGRVRGSVNKDGRECERVRRWG